MQEIKRQLDDLGGVHLPDLYQRDFLLTWEKSRETIRAVIGIASVLKGLRDHGLSTRLFDSGLAVSQFRDNSTRTRFSFQSAANLLGLSVADLDEGKSQIFHGETVRETAAMISFLTEVIGIRDDLFIGRGHAYMEAVSAGVESAFRDGVLPQRPAVINLQSDLDHPTQSLADLMHIASHFGGFDGLKGRKVAMSWAYSPSYGKPLSVPQGVIALFTRFGMDVTLASPPGYSLVPEVMEKAKENAAASAGSFRECRSMEEAFDGAHVVYPKSWASFAVMEERTRLVEAGEERALKDLERRCLLENARYTSWQCTGKLMAGTDEALYLHCLPADISGVSCAEGEVSSEVFERFRVPLHRQAGYKPYVIAAIILASRVADPAACLSRMMENPTPRVR
jgi:knotted carbamoyltransferase YgeW